MKRLPRPARPRACLVRPLVGAAVALACAGAAQAQLRPYYLTASQTINYDSNVFRVSEDEDSDLISTTSLTVGVDQPIGRQRVYGSLGTRYTAYRDNSDLDGLGYSAGVGLDWEAGSKFSGNARAAISESQASFDQYGSLQRTETGKNEERSKTVDLSVQYGRVGILSLEALGNYTDIDYSANDFASRERKSRMFGGGVRWRPGGPWSFGLTARRTHGEYPAFATSAGDTVSDDFDRTDLDLTALYVATGKSNLSLRLTQTREDHERDEDRDFDGLTGALSWRYRATGKVSMALTVTRETGSGASFFTGTVITDPDLPTPPIPSLVYLTDSTRTDTVSLNANWQATGRIDVTLGLRYARDRFDNRFVTDAGEDDSSSRGSSRSVRLGASYAITRVWSAACGLGYEKRSTEARTGLGEYGYDARTGYCSVTLALR